MEKAIVVFIALVASNSCAVAADNLAGTPASAVTISSEQDLGYLNSRSVTFDRLQPQLRTSSIPMYGDSITEAMDVSQIGTNVVNMGVNGSTIRDFLGRVNRSEVSGPAIIHNCQAGIFALGINDTQYEYQNGAPQNPPYLIDLASGWMTGKWVIVKILPVNETMYSGVTNSEIDAVNIEFDKDFGNRTGFVIIDAKSALAPTGQLDPANTIDGLHLSATGYAKLYPLIQSAISSLGINVGM
jgi:lysophospholipase L1-like esterase